MLERLLKEDKRYRMRVTRNGNEAKIRRWCRYTGMGPEANFGVVNSCVDALEQAVLERCFFVEVNGKFERVLRVKSNAFESVEELRTFRNCVVEHVSGLATVASLKEVVATYRGPKQKVYMRAYRSLVTQKLTIADRVLKMFAKFEKAVVTKAARVINPPSARYGLKLGKYLKKSEHLYFQGINKACGSDTAHTVIKGLDIYDSAQVLREKWNCFHDPVAVGADAKKFDAHVSVAALKFEHLFYTMVFNSDELRRLLFWQLSSKAVGYVEDGKVECQFPGRRCSGDLNTSLGNCILMCSMITAYCRQRHIHFELANNGDDCVIVMERRDLGKFHAEFVDWMANRGFRMELEDPVEHFEEIVFCQSQPVFDGYRWRMVRNPITCLTKDPMCLKSIYTPKALAKWRGAVGRGGMSLALGIPVLQSFYGCMARNTRQCSRRYFENVVCGNTSLLSRGGSYKTCEPKEITSWARASFAFAFGIMPATQIAMEKYYDSLTLHDNLSIGFDPAPLVITETPIVKI